MLKDIQITNFKSININEPLNLSGCTILCGSNSSGKSSLIQVILMLCQTLGSRFHRDEMVLNGHMVRLGSFFDIKKHNHDKAAVNVKFTIEFDDKKYRSQTKKIFCDITFGANKKSNSERGDDDIFHPKIIEAEYKIFSEINQQHFEDIISIKQRILSAESKDDSDESYEVVFFESHEKEKFGKLYPDFDLLGVNLIGGFPSFFNVKYNHTKKISSHIINMLVDGGIKIRRQNDLNLTDDEILLPATFFEKLRDVVRREKKDILDTIKIPQEILDIFKENERIDVDFIKEKMVAATFPVGDDVIDEDFLSSDVNITDWKEYLSSLEEEKKKAINTVIDKYRGELQEAWHSGTQIEWREVTYQSQSILNAKEYISYYATRAIKYLGPLRNEPQAIYSALVFNEPNQVGLKGENSAAVLHLNKNKKIKYFSPHEVDGKFFYEEKTGTFNFACQDWLSYLGVIKEIRTKDKGKLGYEMSVKTSDSDHWQDLTHVGVGVSQVLPIVLMFLLSSPDDLLIFEQPELHLHPKVQSRLGDLFRVMAATSRQCIIETHSEYIINRNRLRIAQDDSSDAILESSIFFVVKRNGQSEFETVKINKYGAIINWPEDFFDQTDSEVEKILSEAAKKRKRELRKGGAEI